VKEPDWHGAYISLEAEYDHRIGWLYAFAAGLEDHAPLASAQLQQALNQFWAREVSATRRRFHLPGAVE
jgi:hypothetical protein